MVSSLFPLWISPERLPVLAAKSGFEAKKEICQIHNEVLTMDSGNKYPKLEIFNLPKKIELAGKQTELVVEDSMKNAAMMFCSTIEVLFRISASYLESSQTVNPA